MNKGKINKEDLTTTMYIYAPKGFRVCVTEISAKNGYTYDSELIEEHLELLKVYFVEQTIVGRSKTEVKLQGFPNILFNSVNFVNVDIPDLTVKTNSINTYTIT